MAEFKPVNHALEPNRLIALFPGGIKAEAQRSYDYITNQILRGGQTAWRRDFTGESPAIAYYTQTMRLGWVSLVGEDVYRGTRADEPSVTMKGGLQEVVDFVEQRESLALEVDNRGNNL